MIRVEGRDTVNSVKAMSLVTTTDISAETNANFSSLEKSLIALPSRSIPSRCILAPQSCIITNYNTGPTLAGRSKR